LNGQGYHRYEKDKSKFNCIIIPLHYINTK
jgi:hypothetical protein